MPAPTPRAPRRRRRPRASRASSRPESASPASRRSRLSATNPRRDDDVPDDDDRYDDRYDRPREPRKGTPPDVTLLTQREVQSLIPVGATDEQYAHFWGGAETAVQRLGFSLSDFVATVNASALLAVPAATFFLWAPGGARREADRPATRTAEKRRIMARASRRRGHPRGGSHARVLRPHRGRPRRPSRTRWVDAAARRGRQRQGRL